jgi:uncharacterized protein YcaQ
MDTIALTNRQARRFLLAHQALWPPHQLDGKEALLGYIHRVGCIQYDPLNIVGHNPELVLQARGANFRAGTLRELLYQDRLLVEGWDKNMSIYPVEDWACFQRRRDVVRRSDHASYQAVRSILPQVRRAVEERGPLSSLDLDFDQSVDWSWAPARLARAALESMYDWGELIVHHRVHTRRFYDFAHRHLHALVLSAPDPNVTDEQYHDWYTLRRVGSIGLVWDRAGDAWLGMFGMKTPERRGAFERLLERDLLLKVKVKGIDPPLYMRSEDREMLDRVLQAKAGTNRATIMAPLDNLLWDRRLVSELFDFYYVWEVYKPVADREFGYYVLPIIYGDRFIARFEPGRHKESGALSIKNWWWEEGIRPSKTMQVELARCFRRFLKYLETDRLIVDRELSSKAGLGWLEDVS